MTEILYEALNDEVRGDVAGVFGALRGVAADTPFGNGVLGAFTPLRMLHAGSLMVGVRARSGALRGIATERGHTSVVGRLSELTGYATDRGFAPTVQYVFGALNAPTGAIEARQVVHGNVLGQCVLHGVATEGANAVRGECVTRVRARQQFVYVAGISAFQPPGYMAMTVSAAHPHSRLSEYLRVRGRPVLRVIKTLVERLALSTRPTTALQAISHLRDAVDFIDQIGVVWKLLLQDAVQVAGAPAPSLVAMERVHEILRLVAGPGSALQVRRLVAEALALNDALAVVAKEQIGETAAFAAAFSSALQARMTLLDQLLVNDVAAGAARVHAMIDESIVLGDTPSSVLEALNRLHGTIGFSLTVRIGDDTYLAWVVNTETRAAWTYENYPFNSFCEFEGRYYGAAADGIYTLDGADDAGEDIKARFRLGLNNLGTGKMKRVPSLYLGYRSDGTLVLKVISTSPGGEKEENWYRLTPQHAGATREGRIKIGRGIKSVYFDFEVANVNGADFDVDALELFPMILDRRIGGE